MWISKINEYSYSYADYLISDGKREIRCVCNSVPLPNGLEPKIGMAIKKLYAFCYEDILMTRQKTVGHHNITKTEKNGFQYKIIGAVINKKESLIKAFDFIISLEYFYPDGIDEFDDGDVVSVLVDRIECELDI
jgi:hypothetical protein